MSEPAVDVSYTLDVLGPPPADCFISICIPTYRRAPKVRRLLGQLTKVIGASPNRRAIEVVVSNNASPDGTAEVLREMSPALGRACHVRLYTQHLNIGGEANFKFLYEQAKGTYVWIYPDDDILYEDQFDELIGDLRRYRPEVCVSTFEMPPYNEQNPVFPYPVGSRLTVTDVGDAAPLLTRLPKLTAYVYRHRTLTPRQRDVSDLAARTTSYWFVALSVLLLRNYEPTLLVRCTPIARVDDDYLDLNFSPRVLPTIVEAYRLGLGAHVDEVAILARIPVPDVGYELVACIFRHVIGMNTMNAKVVRDDYAYLWANLWPIIRRRGWRHAVKMVAILLLFPVTQSIRTLRAR